MYVGMSDGQTYYIQFNSSFTTILNVRILHTKILNLFLWIHISDDTIETMTITTNNNSSSSDNMGRVNVNQSQKDGPDENDDDSSGK